MTESTFNAWVTGAGGLIGNYLVQTASRFAPSRNVRGLARTDLDLMDFDAVRQAFNAERPQLIIHCAAQSRTGFCEANPAVARRNNVDVTALLAELASAGQFVFLSTDLVFDGRTGNYDEAADTNPLGVYAETKLAAEQIVGTNPRHTILRLALNAGESLTRDRAFNEQMRIAWEGGETVDLFTDEFRCPIHASVTARAIWELVTGKHSGIFHLGGTERLSRFEIGKLLATRWPGLNPKINAASLRGFKGAPRSPDVSMNCSKVQKLLSFPLPRFSKWLAENPNGRV